MNLCGHAILSTAICLKTTLDCKSNKIILTKLDGNLIVFNDCKLYNPAFLSRTLSIDTLPTIIEKLLNIKQKKISNTIDYVLVN